MNDPGNHHRRNEVAVIGMSGRFPGAHTLDRFWENLRNGVESVTFFRDEELLASGIDAALLRNPHYVKASAVIDGIDRFDAALFGMNPREAAVTDPQQRLFLECAWEALEHAGYDPERYAGAVGVFAGCKANAYLPAVLPGDRRLDGLESLQSAIGNEQDFLATRVSYKLNLSGPSITVQTACSTSLVAVHVACQSLLAGECDMALAGGVSIRIPQRMGYIFEEGGIASPDGHCRAFDADARGTVYGNGLGIVVLKRLIDAVEDGDHIHAVVKGSAVNNDGARKVGFTAPSVEGQTRVIAEAIAMAGVPPGSITYVEAHGTGTALGDPIEIASLSRAFRTDTNGERYCAIGSVKTNIGHLDTAAGIAGLIKAILSLEHGYIPPSLNFSRPNPEIDFTSSPFFVNTELRAWEAFPRRAGVSSFGFGGTNAHVVLEEAPPRGKSQSARSWHLVTLSARSGAALERMTENLAAHLEHHPDIETDDVAFTCQVGRREMAHRGTLVCRDAAEAVEILRDTGSARYFTASDQPANREVAFMFPGQGAQYVGMGRGLYLSEPPYREAVDHCSRLLEAESGFDLREVLYPPQGSEEEAARRLIETSITQPALFVVEYALARYLMSLGIRPASMTGHSIGEYVAAAVAGVYSLEDALVLVAARGRLMEEMPPGAMLAVSLGETELGPMLREGLAIAAVNRPDSCVVSGPAERIASLERELEARNIDARRLKTSHAFHSTMMDPVLEPFKDILRGISLHPPEIPFLSNVTGRTIRPDEATDPEYWSVHLRETVRFSECLTELAGDPDRVLLEVGPSRTLTTLMRQHPARNAEQIILQTLPHPQDTRPDDALFSETLGRLWLAGAAIDWEAFNGDGKRRRVPLPTYPFERKRYWIDRHEKIRDVPPPSCRTERPPRSADIRLGIDDWFSVPSWTRSPPVASRAAPPEGGRWLVFTDECGLGVKLAGKLAGLGQHVVTVRRGSIFDRQSDGGYTLNIRSRRDYTDLALALARGNGRPERIVHAWGVTDAGERGRRTGTKKDKRSKGENPLAVSQYRGFYSLLFLAQALGELGGAPIDISVITNGMVSISGEEEIAPEKATVLGPCMVIPLEYPNITCRGIDVSLPPPGSRMEERLVDLLITEFAGKGAGETVAYRGTDRWIQTFDPVCLPGSAERPGAVRENGVYMITGGLGGIGRSLAELLARTTTVKLALIGRTGVPPGEGRDAWLVSHDETDETSRRIRSLRALEDAGAEVLVIEADVTDEDELRRAARRIRRRFGRIDGVIHAAGSAGGGIIQLKTEDEAERVLAPKVQGTLALERVLRRDDLDFFILCSSLNSILPAFGQVDYCAANCFIDAFAHSRKARTGTFTVAIDWDGWRDVGMATTARAIAWSDRLMPAGGREVNGYPLIDRCIEESESRCVFLTVLDARRHWILNEHRLRGNAVLPGTAYIEIAREAAGIVQGGGALELGEVSFMKPIVVPDDHPVEVYTVLTASGGSFDFAISTRRGAAGTPYSEHAAGTLRRNTEDSAGKLHIGEIEARCTVDKKTYGKNGGKSGEGDVAQYGPRWNNLRAVSIGNGEALGALELAEEFAADFDAFVLHPALLDTATGVAIELLTGADYLPFWYRRLIMWRPLPRSVFSHVRCTEGSGEGAGTVSFDITITDHDGTELMRIEDFTMQRVAGRDVFATGDESERRRGMRTGDAHGGEERDIGRTGLGEHGIRTEEGQEVFSRVLAGNVWPQVIVSTRELSSAMERARSLTGERIAEAGGSRSAATVHERPGIATPYVEPRSAIEWTMAEIWRDLLGIDRVGVRDNFFELGGDSVLGLRIVAQSGKRGIRITPPMLFRHQTIEEIAGAVEAQGDVRIKEGPAGPAPPGTAELKTAFPESQLTKRELDRLKKKLDAGREEGKR